MVWLWVWWPLLSEGLHWWHVYLFVHFFHLLFLVYFAYMRTLIYLLWIGVFNQFLLLFFYDFLTILWSVWTNESVKTLDVLVWWDRWHNAVTSLLIHFYCVFAYNWCPDYSERLFAWLDWKTISMGLLFNLHFIWIILFLELTLIYCLRWSNLIKFLIR